MTIVTLKGVPISFPFEPYPIQKTYMEKVLDCLQNETHGVLESPTGTGKTLSLLCSTLAWLQLKKAQIQAQREIASRTNEDLFLKKINEQLDDATGQAYNLIRGNVLPKIIYASRTHSQLSQAMQEMKRSAYSDMKAVILGSRDQMCIHPEVEREENRNYKIMMCRLKVKTKACKFYNKVEKFKDKTLSTNTIMDIEDLVGKGKECSFCPFYMAKELKESADIVFMPYNYLLDPSIRKSLNIQLSNCVVILDEAHNVERICEDSASLQIKSSDVALALEEVTAIMKIMSDETMDFGDAPRDFTAEELCQLKEVLLNLEKEIDGIDLKRSTEGVTMEGIFLYELFEKVGIRQDNFYLFVKLINNVVQYLATMNDGPFSRKGNSLQMFEEILNVVFSINSGDCMQKIKKCYKVHIQEEEVKKKAPNNWLSKMTSSRAGGKIINYWCFSPGFGMKLLLREGLRTLILTSGTLAPLNPLISELELDVKVKLENPHIIDRDQICVKILPVGPDSEPLNSGYQNRDNMKYINSLGMSISNICLMVPDGMLIFFPSYTIMLKCQNAWQESGIWGRICKIKQIFVEPRDKNSFNAAMTEYYSNIKDPNTKGAIFMGVCRGKVSEGLDFADANGRTVLITGLPFPPLKDPRVILKRQYLDRCNAEDKQFLRGQEWYSLEASRAVNQAIGRVIRHKDDYGAILLLDNRFNSPSLRNQMSLWVRDQIKVCKGFGEIMRDLKVFFKNADAKYKAALERKSSLISPVSDVMLIEHNSMEEVVIHKRNKNDFEGNPSKKAKLHLVKPTTSSGSSENFESSTKEYFVMVKRGLDDSMFKDFKNILEEYKSDSDLKNLTASLDTLFKGKYHLKYLIPGLEPFINKKHKVEFSQYCQQNGLLDV
ncbi:unnamed protein product [Phyllotreta striolata]|uniref:Regulator of telomere elongation helicase 1 homolog n=1 Tax=Phyllotreta striolata TaxID=444603 RepID=A0A9N9TR47_PHYSR|nr:unnamed protein product [Phyllotreta striolata]